jgi:predicted Ser/Thr protein kinase
MPYCPECSASVPEGAAQCPTCGSALVTTPSAADETRPEAPALDIEQLRAELAASLAPRYEVLKLLGSGGMGAVFLAREPALRRLVAVKVLSPYLAAEPKARSRFEREARAAAALSHPNVVRVYAVGETATTRVPYIIMQYVEGATLGQWMAGRKRVPEREARRIIGEVAAALAAAHARELVHRDVKPSNVLIETESGRAFVADFGVSAALSPVDQATKLTMTGTIVGTPAYMSPEQAAAEPVGPKSDVYSLGLLAYELLTGALPYSATSAMGWAAAHLRDPATPVGIKRPDLSPDVARLVDRCLAKRPEERPEAEDVSRAMMPSLEGEIPWPPPGLDWLRGRGRVLARVSLLAVAGGLMTFSALTFTPRILQVHPYWLARFTPVLPQSETGLVAVRDLGATSQFVWQSLLIVGLTAFAASVVGLAIAAAQTGRFLWTRRHRGWRWQTLIDVAVDHDGKSGLLLVGAREFASLDAAVRRQVLRARRVRTIGELSAGVWLAVVGLAWAASLVTGLVSNAAIASPMALGYYWAATLPAITALVAGALADNRERRLTSVVTKRPAFVESEADIAVWYGGVPDVPGPEPARPGPARTSALAVPVAIAGLTLVVLLAIIAAAASALVGAIVTARLGPGTVQLSAALDAISRDDPIGTARRVAAAYLPAGRDGDDSTTTDRLRRLLWRPGSAPFALLDYHPSPASVYDAWRLAVRPPADPGRRPFRRLAAPGFEVLRRAIAGRIPADTVRLLQATGRHPRTVAFGELVRADHWDLPQPSPAGESASSAWLGAINQAAVANFLAAIGDVAAGETARARSRLGENAAAGLLFLGSPVELASWQGRIMLSEALVHLAELEQLLGDPPKAAELREAMQRLSLLRLLTTFDLPGLAADPANLASTNGILGDGRLPAEWRVRLLHRVFDGACTNPREILLGASPARTAFVRAADTAMPDIPHANELAIVAADSPLRRRFEGAGLPGLVVRLNACLFGS